jgi:hypothetical protein
MLSMLAILMVLGACAKRTSLDLGGQAILVPVPLGFVALGTSSPRFRAFEENILPSVVLIEYYLTDHDFKDVLAGHSKSRDRFLSITMSREMHGRDFSEENFLGASYFRRAVEGKNFVNDSVAANEKTEIRDQKIGAVPHLSIDSKWLGVFLDQHDAIGVASISSTRADGNLKRILNLSVTLRVRDRDVMLGCGAVVSNDDEIQPFENICSQWAKNILIANPSSANQ